MNMIIQSRRGLITGLVSFLAVPAIVRASSLMPVKKYDNDYLVDKIIIVPKEFYVDPNWLRSFAEIVFEEYIS